MTDAAKKRGRPREFEPAAALSGAAEAFLRHGYAGTSVDALSRAMHLNKPSLYAAFGDKHALFLAVLERRFQYVAARYKVAFEKGRTLEEALRNVFEEAVEVSLGEGGPPGCPIAAAETTESLVDDEIREFTRRFRAQTDKGMASWIRTKVAREHEAAAEAIARLANSVLHDLALRARVGEPRTKLREIARDAAVILSRTG